MPDLTVYETTKEDIYIDKVTFTITQGDNPPKDFTIEPKGLPILIGCSNECQIVIKDDRAAKVQVKIYSEDGEIWWEDLASKPSISTRMDLIRIVFIYFSFSFSFYIYCKYLYLFRFLFFQMIEYF